MSEEATNAAADLGAEASSTLTPAEQRETTIINQEDSQPEAKVRPKIEPFFEKEPTEEELMGESEPGDDSAVTQKTDEVGKKEEVKEEKKEDAVKPPPGFVPKGALQEEREKRKQLQAEMETLRAQVEAKAPPPPATPEAQRAQALAAIGLPEDFQVLSEADEDTLMEEDLFAYQKYQRNLRKYERASYAESQKQQVAQQINTRAAAIVEGAVRRMETSVPGLHDPDSEINKTLTEFAINNGFEADYLNAMTDPKTLILPVGAKQPVYLGDGAASIVEFIHKIHSSKAALPTEESIRVSLTKEITEKVTAELMKKFKEGKPSSTYKSLGDAPGSMEVINTSGKITEKELAKLSEEEQAKLLGG